MPADPIRTPQYTIEGSGPLLVYNAGLDGTGKLFFKQTQALSRNYRVVTFRSREQGEFTYDQLADDIAAIILDQGESKATILGESFGGTVALSFALRYPEMTRRLVVINSFARFRGRLRINLGVFLTSRLPFALLQPVRRAASLVGLFVDGISPQDRSCFWEAISSVSPNGYARRLRLIADFDVEDRLADIQAPTLFIAGDRDLLISSVEEARAMAARVPNSAIKIIRGAGHACLMGERVCLAELLSE